tara:strand:- start:1422 stop:1598 length:177 start_codon:yes stop_codon:yes gene_type:complete
MSEEFLREINHDNKTPKGKKPQLNEDGFFLADDCSHPDHQCTCGSKPVESVILTEGLV